MKTRMKTKNYSPPKVTKLKKISMISLKINNLHVDRFEMILSIFTIRFILFRIHEFPNRLLLDQMERSSEYFDHVAQSSDGQVSLNPNRSLRPPEFRRGGKSLRFFQTPTAKES